MKKQIKFFFLFVLLFPLLSFCQPCGVTFLTSDEAIFKAKQETTFFIKAAPSVALIIPKNLPNWLTFNEDVLEGPGVVPTGTWSITGTPPKNKNKKYEMKFVALTTTDPNTSISELFECYECQKTGGCPTDCPAFCVTEQKFTLYVRKK